MGKRVRSSREEHPPTNRVAWQTGGSHLQSPAVSHVINIIDLDFAYGEQLVLKQINLPVEQGSVLGIIGPNGGGKTTLLQLLLGQFAPTRGAITVDGLSPRHAVKRGSVIGYLPQSYSVPGDFPIDVRQVVRLGLVAKTGMLRAHSAADLQFVEWLMQRVGVHELAGRAIGTLSGGQRQRVMIARALAAKPKVLLLDEPTTGIDRAGQQRFIEFIQDLRKELGLTVVLVSHDLSTVSAIADRIACLNVTLHYHDVPERLEPDMIHRVFACAVEAGKVDVTDVGVRRRAELS
jgi:zinc transport system ATP-binding protein